MSLSEPSALDHGESLIGGGFILGITGGLVDVSGDVVSALGLGGSLVVLC